MVNTLSIIDTLSAVYKNLNAAQFTHALKANASSMQEGLIEHLNAAYAEGLADGLVNGYTEGLKQGAAFGYAEGFADGMAQSTSAGLVEKIGYVAIGIGIGVGAYVLITKLSSGNSNKHKKCDGQTKANNTIDVEGKEIKVEPEVTNERSIKD